MIPGWTQGDLGAQSGCLGSEHVAKQDGLNCSIISHEMSQRRPVAAAALVLVLILGPLTAGPLNAAPATPMCQTQASLAYSIPLMHATDRCVPTLNSPLQIGNYLD